MNRALIVALGVAAVAGETALWHGPLGTGERIAQEIEAVAQAELVHYEMTMIDARVAREPLRRTLILSGPADDFQRGELVRVLSAIPGVGDVRWATPLPPREGGR